ncbi:TPA: hypothetical protein MIY22_23865 [Klebsiella pneumoniae]|nr:hypothetical protein [Klebsiella pneumoniae]HBY5564402.1 hypothetical protein [Klebsiella pneumoniae]HBY5574363.1 hypothetical protein [Klebsiella pneumoniae]
MVVLVGLAIDQIAQSGLSSLSVIYYSAHLFRTSQIDKAEMNHPSVRENWARAGEPYIVPQMSDSERNLKIKRFQKPTSGANHGH